MVSRLTRALDALHDALPHAPTEADLVLHVKVRALMIGYDARWRGSEWEALSVEETVVLPVVNPETGRISRTWRQGGKFDGRIEGYGSRLLLEHKTTSDAIDDPDAVYWRRLDIDSQVSKYMLQAWQNEGDKLDGCLYDVIRKPGIRPKKLTKAEISEIESGTYLGMPVEAIEAGAIDRETPDLYEIRLVREVTSDPSRYYQRRTIYRTDDEVVEYAQELWTIGKEIQRARLHDLVFRNTGACFQFSRACPYLGLCSGHDEVASDRWERVANVHPELDGLDGDGRDVLTNSRIKTFQTCRRRHHYQYEVGIRRPDDEDAEALRLGSLMHLALEAWWKGDSDDDRNAVNEAAGGVDQLPGPSHR
jgi:hypothetical protein